ncbi:UPF0235 protein C15orf40 homolog [Eriocheir sinensis]|uniref:UPF0235 protein C15orf40 homolog n=1 Tax=Eriocheir sinensis TaxID=95602 RepID=UPI0021CA9D02|nr:UPF0235 protein C15orf40 homolog [Eriocheir sinensis]
MQSRLTSVCSLIRKHSLARTLAMGKGKAKKAPTKDQTDTTASKGDSEEIISCDKQGNVIIKIFAKPGAKNNGVTGLSDEGVGVQVAAPPSDGEANQELVKYLASVIGVRKSDVSLIRGSRARQKVVAVSSTTRAAVTEKLNAVAREGVE